MKIGVLGTSRSGHNWVGTVVASWFDNPEVVEMTNVEPFNIGEYNLDKDDLLIVVVRSFKQFLASSVKSYLDAHGRDSNWREGIQRYIGAYRAISQTDFPRVDARISYEMFFRGAAYRRMICEKLGGEYNEDLLNYMPNEGGGSSFDKFEYQGKGQQMKTLDRAEQILETEWADIYEELLNENKDLW